jgi:hypothetical protein
MSGSGTDALNFDYVVAIGQDTPDLAVSAISMNSATVTNQAGNADQCATAADRAATLWFKTPPPRLTCISSWAGFYGMMPTGIGDMSGCRGRRLSC